MKKFLTKGQLSALIVIAVLIIDQIIKIWVKTSMYWHESIKITDWFYIYFTENNGMAFGMEIFNKFFLTGFRIIAAIAITWLLIQYVKKNYKTGFLVCVSLILAGAIGNIIDCVFYGEIFSESTHSTIANFVPIGQGYSDWFYGKVVDMFYFPLFDYKLPWMDYPRTFFGAVFNFADSCVTVGAIYLLLFQYKFFASEEEKSKK